MVGSPGEASWNEQPYLNYYEVLEAMKCLLLLERENVYFFHFFLLVLYIHIYIF